MTALELALGYTFKEPTLLELALSHRTWVEEQHPGGHAPAHLSQQRLEFLGDAVLGYALARWLYEALPSAAEGELTDRRKEFAKAEWLQQRGASLGLAASVRLGAGEAAHAERNRRVVADTVEAIIGAVLLDSSEVVAIALVRGWLPTEPPPMPQPDPVTAFIEWFQQEHQSPPPAPEYEAVGPEHARRWTATVSSGWDQATGTGRTKQEAKREACRAFLSEFRGPSGG